MPVSSLLPVNPAGMIVAAKPLGIAWLSAHGVRFWLVEKPVRVFLLRRWIFKSCIECAWRCHPGVGRQLLVV